MTKAHEYETANINIERVVYLQVIMVT